MTENLQLLSTYSFTCIYLFREITGDQDIQVDADRMVDQVGQVHQEIY